MSMTCRAKASQSSNQSRFVVLGVGVIAEDEVVLVVVVGNKRFRTCIVFVFVIRVNFAIVTPTIFIDNLAPSLQVVWAIDQFSNIRGETLVTGR